MTPEVAVELAKLNKVYSISAVQYSKLSNLSAETLELIRELLEEQKAHIEENIDPSSIIYQEIFGEGYDRGCGDGYNQSYEEGKANVENKPK